RRFLRTLRKSYTRFAPSLQPRQRHSQVIVKIGGLVRGTPRLAQDLLPLLVFVQFFYGLKPLRLIRGLALIEDTGQQHDSENKMAGFHSGWRGKARSVQLRVPCQAFSNSARSTRSSLPRSGSFT